MTDLSTVQRLRAEWEQHHGGNSPCEKCVRIVERLLAEAERLSEQLVAVQGAAEELSHWPDLAETPFVALLDGKQYALRPEQVVGIYKAWRKHVETLAPFGKNRLQEIERLAARIAALEAGLRPFVEIGNVSEYGETKVASTRPDDATAALCVSLGAIRAARRLLADGDTKETV
jgi:hypothetical protein